MNEYDLMKQARERAARERAKQNARTLGLIVLIFLIVGIACWRLT